ncbi:hypothetical protein FDECE_17261 [Fusarium decemcellulare]|nr:hypothetical protein FDECE_17261 [Fusarium decemcellulare]
MLWSHMSSLHHSILSAYDEVLERFGEMVWPEPESLGAVPLELIRALKENNPDVRLMHLPTAMRVINRGYEECTPKAEVPFTIAQLLNDLLVVGACRQETAKYHSLVPRNDIALARIHQLDIYWKEQDRPWLSAMKYALAGITEEEYQRLDVKCDKQTNKHHSRFWSIFDKSMEKASWQNEPIRNIHEEMQKTMAIPTTTNQHAEERSTGPFVAGTSEFNEPTRSQVKRSARSSVPRPPQRRAIEAQSVIGSKQSLPVVAPKAQKELWSKMLSPHISAFRWIDWLQGMGDLGFTASDHPGAAVRFVMRREVNGGSACAIVYHKPHSETKIMPKAGRRWVRRLLRHVTIDIDTHGVDV